MKILFIIPTNSFTKEFNFIVPTCVLGVLYLAPILEKNGFKVEIIDMPLLLSKNNNIKERDCIEMIEKMNPDVICFTTSCNTYPLIISFSKKLKELFNKPIVLGGVQATHTAMDTMRAFPWIDIIVRGEGEITANELFKTIKAGKDLKSVNGIVFRDDNKIVETKPRQFIANLDSLSFPAYHLVAPIREYFTEGINDARNEAVVEYLGEEPTAPIITSRGCPFQCTYCSVSTMWNRTPRFRSPENVIKEIRYIKKTQNVNKFHFLDDTFTLNRERTVKLCDMLKKENIKFNMLSRIDTIDEDLLVRLKEAGCKRIFYGIESGSVKTLFKIKKTSDKDFLKQARNIIKKTVDLDIAVIANFIIGFPGESYEEAKKTLDFSAELSKLGALTNIAILSLLPGSELYKIHIDKIKLTYPGRSHMIKTYGFNQEIIEMIENHPRIFAPFYIANKKLIDKFDKSIWK